jgi:hypothetical protein
MALDMRISILKCLQTSSMSPESVLSDYPPEISLECFLLLCCQSLEEVFPYPHTPSSYAPFCTPSPYALFCIPLDIVFPELRTSLSGHSSEALAYMHCSVLFRYRISGVWNKYFQTNSRSPNPCTHLCFPSPERLFLDPFPNP